MVTGCHPCMSARSVDHGPRRRSDIATDSAADDVWVIGRRVALTAQASAIILQLVQIRLRQKVVTVDTRRLS
jgi:hypothetical protein